MKLQTILPAGAPYKTIAVSVCISVLLTLAILFMVYMYVPTQLMPLPLTQSERNEVQELGLKDSIPTVVARSTPAVVSVVISADVPIIEQYMEDYNPFGGFFGQGFNFSIPKQRQVGVEKKEVGGGTGFFASSDGYIVTNRHVVDATGVEYSIVTNEGDSYAVEVVAKDPTLDIAILKVKSDKTFPYLTFGKNSEVKLGATVIAIGNALAEFPNSVSVGVVSGLSRDIVAGDGFGFSESLSGVMQTDAAINQGNSGGPLLNEEGEVIGVNVAVARNGENIGFALPSDAVRTALESVMQTGEINVPFIGVHTLQVTKEIAAKNKLEFDYGVLIIRGASQGDLAVVPGSPADKAGLVENDIILEVDGKKLDSSTSLPNSVREHKIGDTITLKILHDGMQKDVQVTLEKAPSR